MVKFRHDKNQFLEYIDRIESNLPQMIVCSISEVTFDYGIARKFNKAAKNNKHIYQFHVSDSVFKKSLLFKKNSLNLVLDGILSMGFDYINLPSCKLKDCLDADTIKYFTQEQVKSIDMSGSALSSSDVGIISLGISSNKKNN